MGVDKQAEELNEAIKSSSPSIYSMLSEKGRRLFFPKRGIIAQTAEAKGKAINATIGIATERGKPMHLKCISSRISLDADEAFNYAPPAGIEELRKAWKERQLRKNPSLAGKSYSLPIVTNGLTHGLMLAAELFVDEGDEVIIPGPFWGNYKLMLAANIGASIRTFELFENGTINTAALKESLDKEKNIVILNFPNNPAGYTPTTDEASRIISVIREAAENGRKIIAIVDDAYFGLVYEENALKESLFAGLADVHQNVLAIKIDGATKEQFVWGLRVGFITFGSMAGGKLYDALEQKIKGLIRSSVSSCSKATQSLVLKGLESGDCEKEEKEKFIILKERYDEVRKQLNSSLLEALPFNSGYFMCIRLKKADPERVRQLLLTKYDSGVISLQPGLIRVAFSAVSKDRIKELFGNIAEAIKNECV